MRVFEGLQEHDIPFPELIAPLIVSASELLQHRWETEESIALSEAFPKFDHLRSSSWIADDLSAVLGPALLSRFNRLRPLRAQRFPTLFDNSEYYERFVAGGSIEEVPVARETALRIVNQFASQITILLRRLRADSAALSRKLQISCPNESLVEIRYGLSDRHSFGATVCSLRFADGDRLIYKPRSLRCEDVFSRAVAIITRDLPARLACKPPTILDQESYGWCNELKTRQVISRAAAARFYYRSGVLCACAHVLALTDCHDGNLLASGEHAFVVDCETLGHPEPAFSLSAFDSVEKAFRAGVVRTGFLPSWKSDGSTAVLDAAALADSRHITWRSLRFSWRGLGTDGLTALAHRSYAKASANLPLAANGEPHQPSGFIEEICDGFADGLAAARGAKEELLVLTSEKLADAEARFIFRDTDVYYAVLSEAMRAADYENYQTFDDHISRLRGGRAWPPDFTALIDHEIRSIRRGDIPRFTLPVAHASHVHSGSERVSFRFARPPAENIRRHIEGDGAADDAFEISTLRNTLEILDVKTAPGFVKAGVYDCPSPTLRSDIFSRACELGDQLVAGAVPRGDHVGWLAPVRVGATANYNYRPIPNGLYDGKLGIALFLTWLFRRSGQHQYIDCARHALASSPLISASFGSTLSNSSAANSEVLFSLAVFTRLLDDPTYASNAAQLISRNRDSEIGSDLGILNGRAGEILARLALYEVTGATAFVEDALRFALVPSEPDPSLGAAAVRTGLAHGEAGFGLALLKLWSVTGDTTFLAGAQRCLAREVSAWNERKTSRAVQSMFRDRVATELSWCNGYVGMLLLWQRLVGPNQGSDALETFALSAYESRIHGNDSLCCGSFGHAGVLHLLDQQAHAGSRSPLAKLCFEDTERAWTLLSKRFPIQPPGLFSGLAGIGASCLAASTDDPELSILTFELAPSMR